MPLGIGGSGHKGAELPVLIVALLVPAVSCALAFAVIRCRRAGRLVDRIIAEELGPRHANAGTPARERHPETIS